MARQHRSRRCGERRRGIEDDDPPGIALRRRSITCSVRAEASSSGMLRVLLPAGSSDSRSTSVSSTRDSGSRLRPRGSRESRDDRRRRPAAHRSGLALSPSTSSTLRSGSLAIDSARLSAVNVLPSPGWPDATDTMRPCSSPLATSRRLRSAGGA
jgi:hypothetical protein